MGASYAARLPAFPRRSNPVLTFFVTLARLVLPVAALMAALAAALWGLSQPLAALDPFLPQLPESLRPGAWMTYGHGLIALSLFAVTLANRRYGLGLAALQIVIGLGLAALLGALVLSETLRLPAGLPPELTAALAWPAPRSGLALAGALVFSHVVAAAIFNWTRGGHWSRAPLYAGLWGAIAFAGVFHAGVGYDGDMLWIARAAMQAALLAAAAVVLLIPYYLLRPLIRPLAGYGGY